MLQEVITSETYLSLRLLRGDKAIAQMEQLVAKARTKVIVAVCRLAILKRMPATPLTLLVAHRLREQSMKAQVQRSGKMKT